jgi:hypothetical protein
MATKIVDEIDALLALGTTVSNLSWIRNEIRFDNRAIAVHFANAEHEISDKVLPTLFFIKYAAVLETIIKAYAFELAPGEVTRATERSSAAEIVRTHDSAMAASCDEVDTICTFSHRLARNPLSFATRDDVNRAYGCLRRVLQTLRTTSARPDVTHWIDIDDDNGGEPAQS